MPYRGPRVSSPSHAFPVNCSSPTTASLVRSTLVPHFELSLSSETFPAALMGVPPHPSPQVSLFRACLNSLYPYRTVSRRSPEKKKSRYLALELSLDLDINVYLDRQRFYRIGLCDFGGWQVQNLWGGPGNRSAMEELML